MEFNIRKMFVLLYEHSCVLTILGIAGSYLKLFGSPTFQFSNVIGLPFAIQKKVPSSAWSVPEVQKCSCPRPKSLICFSSLSFSSCDAILARCIPWYRQYWDALYQLACNEIKKWNLRYKRIEWDLAEAELNASLKFIIVFLLLFLPIYFSPSHCSVVEVNDKTMEYLKIYFIVRRN